MWAGQYARSRITPKASPHIPSLLPKEHGAACVCVFMMRKSRAFSGVYPLAAGKRIGLGCLPRRSSDIMPGKPRSKGAPCDACLRA